MSTHTPIQATDHKPTGPIFIILIDGRIRRAEEFGTGFYTIMKTDDEENQRGAFHDFPKWDQVKKQMQQGKTARTNGNLYAFPPKKFKGPQMFLYYHGTSNPQTVLHGSEETGYLCQYTGRTPGESAIKDGIKPGEFSILKWEDMEIKMNEAAQEEYKTWEETDKEGFDWCLNCLPPLRWEGEEFVQCSECTHLDYYPVVIKVNGKYYKGDKPRTMSPHDMAEEIREQLAA